jgi:DNA adenine methylase
MYLNKRCFNGLYRENRSGEYNVPYKQYNTDIFHEDEILNLSRYFNQNDIQFYNRDFTEFDISFFNQNDIVYIDPPYYQSNKSGFTSYWKTPFLIKEQIKLLEFCKALDRKGVKFILSNSPCREIRDMYSPFNQYVFWLGRQMRSGKGKSETFEKKNEENEILIWNFSKLIFMDN